LVTVASSQLITATLQSALSTIGAGLVTIYDISTNPIATLPLTNPAGVVFNDLLIVQSGLPTVVTASSVSPVGAVPTSASLFSSAGVALLKGIPIYFATTGLILASSVSNPGQALGLVAMTVSSEVI